MKNQNLPIGGTVHGMWTGADGVALRLTANGVDSLFTVTANGSFKFPVTLDEGVSYATTVVSSPARHTCALAAGANGIVDASGVATIDVACAGPMLSVTLSAPAPWTFDPTQQVQTTLSASVLLQSVNVTISSADGLVTSAIVDGVPTGLGVPSGTRNLSLGPNAINVAVSAQGGLSTTYQIVIDRGVTVIAQAAYGKASNTGSRDYFGLALAASGDTLVVGASGEASRATGVNGDQSDDSANSAGAAFVFRRTGSVWAQEAYLKASNTETFDDFGVSVAISGDTIAVGAPGEDSGAIGINGNQADNTATHAGAVYVFQRTAGGWAQQAYLKASNTGAEDSFGSAVALSGDTLAVGAYGEGSPATGINGDQGNGTPGAGAVYVFTRGGAAWVQQAYVKASNTEAGDGFGYRLALDGDTLVVGAAGEDSAAPGVNADQTDNGAGDAGAAYVFVRTQGAWSQQAYLKASNAGAGDFFGWAVALSGDTLAIGAPSEDSRATGVNGNQSDNGAGDAGAVYIFVRSAGTWTQQAYLKASNPQATDSFGSAVAVGRDTVAVGAHLQSSGALGINGTDPASGASTSGAAYLFQRDGTSWSQRAYIKASNADPGDRFGEAVVLSRDQLIVGAGYEASNTTGLGGDQMNNSAVNAGAVYLFR